MTLAARVLRGVAGKLRRHESSRSPQRQKGALRPTWSPEEGPSLEGGSAHGPIWIRGPSAAAAMEAALFQGTALLGPGVAATKERPFEDEDVPENKNF